MKNFFHFLFFAMILSCTNEEHIDEKCSIPESSTDSIETEVIEKKSILSASYIHGFNWLGISNI